MKFRVGFGYDVHQLKEGEDLWLGGVKIDHNKGTVGHTDADILIHVICDALLGAANFSDIGFQFPDSDPKYKGIDSKILLQKVMELLKESNYQIGNVDSTICLQAPKVNPHITEMKACLAPILGIPEEDISIKATTSEKMGFVGREDGVTGYATVLIYRD